jgi:class 3 adenylate cyclase/tetratricopeptide (TPR) repeat protein
MEGKKMKCPKCQFENAEGIKFCGECGNKLDVPAEAFPKDLSFDEKIAKIQKYLPQGLTEKILSQKDRIEGERKQVTVMFCDMEGFTPLVEALGPEAAYSVMDQVYEILIHKVHDFEGTVNEMTGDGIMALFGAPIALEDAPQRALRSALAIHEEIADFNRQRKGIDSIKMRIGIHTGPVVVGTLGNDLRVEFKAVGDTVNLASRMEGLAEAGSTFVTEETFKFTESLFRFEALGEKAVKGKGSAGPVYKLLSAKESIHRPRLGLERSIYSEMVGRDKELDRLEFQVMKAVNGEGSIVNIIGEAGIGKSRLMAELKNRDVLKRVILLEGRAVSTGRNLSFHPIIDLLKHWARIGENDSEASALSKLETAIRRIMPREVQEVLPFVATLMGMRLRGRYAERVKGIEGEALEKLILKTMRDLLIKATELNSLVIVAEDLHWADTSSIELLESLFRLAETQRIVFINVFRPGYKETGDRIVETIKERYTNHYFEISLQPLDKRISEALINNMLNIKGLKHAVIDQIVERADGNPFFIEEVVRSFIDQGAIVAKDGVFEVTEKIDTMVIPHTINDVLMARIDRLEEKTRDLVKVASVIGRNFFYRILTKVAQTVDAIDSRLSYLKEIQLIREQRRMEELEYLFKHALAQEAAYESILLQMRKELHLKVADSIEKVFRERLHEFYGMLAFHYSKGENLDKAEEYMIKAGEEALSSSASHEALRYYREALDLYLKKYGQFAETEKLAMFEINIALALFNKGEYEAALTYFDSALKCWGIKPPKRKLFMFTKLMLDLFCIVFYLYFPSKGPQKIPTDKDSKIFNLCHKKIEILAFQNAMRFFAEAIGEIRRMLKYDFRKIENWSHIFLNGSVLFAFSGLSCSVSKRLLEYGERIIDKNNFLQLCDLKHFRLLHNVCCGKWKDIQDFDKLLIDEFYKVGKFNEISFILFFDGLVKINQGKLSFVYSLLEKLAKIADDYDYKIAKASQLDLELFLYLYFGKLNEAKETVEKWDSLFRITSDNISIHFLGYKAELLILLKDYDGAERSLRKIYDITRQQSFVPPMVAGPYLWSRFFLDMELLEEAILHNNKADYTKYKKRASESGNKLLRNAKKNVIRRSGYLFFVGRYHWLIGQQNKAVKLWKRAIEDGMQLGQLPDLARTYMEIGSRLLEKQSKYKEIKSIGAKEYLEKAKMMFAQLDMQWDLDRFDKIFIS